jgi:hypothetical protein
MADRVNEDIRFYLPADPYYYQVDNLPLEDLLTNDVRLQNQIDELKASDTGNTVTREGIRELQPFIDTALPGTISVRPGNFIGRVQRSSGPGLPGTNVTAVKNGTNEMNEPPTLEGEYSVGNPPNKTEQGPADTVGRTSVFNFQGGNIAIESFNFNDFGIGGTDLTTPPLGRLDLVGITTVNGAMDDPYLPGNETGGVDVGDGYAKLAVVKGAGMIGANDKIREIQIGEKFITVGQPQERINDYGRDIDGNVVPNPEFGTVPMPDDVVNVCMSRSDVQQSLQEFAELNQNASFFLPLAYVFVPESHVEGNPLAEGYLHDIRPFFRTAELTQAERQAVANSLNPSIRNPFTTVSHVNEIISGPDSDLDARLRALEVALTNRGISDLIMFADAGGVHKKIQAGNFGFSKTFNAYNFGVPPTASHVLLTVIGRADNTSQDLFYIAGNQPGTNRNRVMRFLGNSEGGPGGDNSTQFFVPIEVAGQEGLFTLEMNGVPSNMQALDIFLEGYMNSATVL